MPPLLLATFRLISALCVFNPAVLVSSLPQADSPRYSFSFLAVGDHGVNTDGDTAERRAFELTASAMDKELQEDQPGTAFMALLGDNIYENGAASVHDPAFASCFEAIFPFGYGLKWYSILGNHDYGERGTADPQAQVQYTYTKGYLAPSKGRWYMPERRYMDVARYANVSMCIIGLDTPLRSGYSFRADQGEDLSPLFEQEYLWFEEHLSSAGCQLADWVVVLGHNPLMSDGFHGTQPHMKRFLELSIKYNVDLYLSGHDHNSQHAFDSGVHNVLLGAGAKLESARYNREDRVDFFDGTQNAFGKVSVAADGLRVDYMNHSNEAFHSILIAAEQRTRRRSKHTALTTLASKLDASESVGVPTVAALPEVATARLVL